MLVSSLCVYVVHYVGQILVLIFNLLNNCHLKWFTWTKYQQKHSCWQPFICPQLYLMFSEIGSLTHPFGFYSREVFTWEEAEPERVLRVPCDLALPLRVPPLPLRLPRVQWDLLLSQGYLEDDVEEESHSGRQ